MFERWQRRRVPAAGDDAAALEGSGLFDATFYRRCNPDVVAAGSSPLDHFCDYGWREGRRPNALFDPAWYARTHRLDDNDNPLVHYLQLGEAAGLRPIAFFDPKRHRRWHGLSRRRSALAHYLAPTFGTFEPEIAVTPKDEQRATSGEEEIALARSGLFDASLYLVESPDVREAGWPPLAHYWRWGWRDGRRPNLYFDPFWYRARHLGDAEIDPLSHYRRVGEAANLRPITTFDPGWYRRHYALAPGTSPLAHFLAHRRMQRVSPNAYFDPAFHMKKYGSALGPDRDPFAHFLLQSLTRDLDPAPGFDATAYRADSMAAELALPEPKGPAVALTRSERNVPLVHFLDALP